MVTLNGIIWVLMGVLSIFLVLSFFIDFGPFVYLLIVGVVALVALDFLSRQRQRRRQ